MTAYDFRPEFEARILDGSKTFTLRAPSGKRPPDVGKSVQIYVGLRSFLARKIAERRCVLRARLTLTPTGVLRVSDLTHLEAAQALARLLEGLEQSDARAADNLPKFAAMDGFEDYAAFYDFHLETERRHKRPTPKGRIVRDLIAWGHV
jgi:hypothetical protein